MDDFAQDNLLAPEEGSEQPLKTFFIELLKVLIIGAFAVVAIRYFIFKPFVVKGTSMEPNFHESEYLIIDELTYRVHPPSRGDIIVLRYNGGAQSEFFLKRVVGLPGERVIVVGGRVKIVSATHPSGMLLDEEKYLSQNVVTTGDIDITLGSDEYYVLGDNRPASLDSRRIGPIHAQDIVGRVLLRGYPLSRIELFNGPFLQQ